MRFKHALRLLPFFNLFFLIKKYLNIKSRIKKILKTSEESYLMRLKLIKDF